MSKISEIKHLTITASTHKYHVRVGEGLFSDYFTDFNGYIIADKRFETLFKHLGVSKVVYVEAVEDNKTLATVESVMISLKNMGMTRDDPLVAVGGGIIQDIATLSASLYMRGVAWIYFPTTLLGMTDSCIGGKSSINAGDVKNLVGNIYPPRDIFIDIDFIKTLNQADLHAGLSEAAKIASCKGSDAFETFLSFDTNSSPNVYTEMLFFILSQKKWFIEIDEFDRAERKFLNFGHTFGHALESATNHLVPHGIAVAIGIRAAIAFVSEERVLSDLEQQLDSYMANLSHAFSATNSLTEIIDWVKYASAFSGDKKHSVDAFKLITPMKNGQVEIRPFPKNNLTIERVIKAQRAVLGESTK